MLPLLRRRPERVLCIGAHADDIEIGCGGTILSLLALVPDLHVHWLVLSGANERAAEARDGAARILADAREPRVEVEAFEDTAFPYREAEALKRRFRELAGEGAGTSEGGGRPDLVFTHRRADMHQDHRFVAELTWQHFRDHMILEYEIPKYEGDLGRPNVFVPLEPAVAERKVAAITGAFASQRDKPWFGADTFHAMHRLRGNECRSPTGLAEAFHADKMVLL